jgi:ABC-type dipeptide/oligopeptide/nickel transport system permease component
MIPIAVGISILMFALLTLAPGDPVDLRGQTGYLFSDGPKALLHGHAGR